MRKKGIRISMAIAGASLITMGFQNCGPGFNTLDAGSASFNSMATGGLVSPFRSSKVVISGVDSSAGASGTFSGKASAVSAELPLMMIVSNDCFEALSSSEKAKILGDDVSLDLSKRNPSLSKQAYPIRLKKALTKSDLEELVRDKACVVGITDNPEVKVGQVAIDPRLAEQEFHQTIKNNDASAGAASAPPVEPVVVAVIDSGVDFNHEDLKDVMWKDSTGAHGINMTSDDKRDVMDRNSHGTHVAGLIAARAANGIGGRGVAGDGTQIMAIKALNDQGSGSLVTVFNAVIWAVDNKADIINMSLSSLLNTAGYEEAIMYAANRDVLVVVAAGNEGFDLAERPRYPAVLGYRAEGVMTVGSINEDSLQRSSFSNWGADRVEIYAPGSRENSKVGILSTLPGNTYGRLRGTSMATPIVAGAAAAVIHRLRVNNQKPTAAYLEKVLKESATEEKTKLGANGRVLNVERTLASVGAIARLPDQDNAELLSDPTSMFLKRLYAAVLKRTYDRDGLLYWKAQLENGGNLYDVVASFMTSEEFMAQLSWNEKIPNVYGMKTVDAFYTAMYGTWNEPALMLEDRDPIQKELWPGRITKEEAWRRQMSSARFDARMKELGISHLQKFPTGSEAPPDVSMIVSRLYLEVLERQPDTEGLTYYVGTMRNGRSEAQIRGDLQASPEFAYLGYYKLHFGRTPQMAEILAHNADLAAGRKTLAQLKEDLRASPNCKTDCKNGAGDPSLNYGAKVIALYLEVLERQPDLEGMAYYSQLMENGRTEAQVRGDLKASYEFIFLGYYKTHLGRKPSITEITANNAALNSGAKTLSQIRDIVRASADCKTDCLPTTTPEGVLRNTVTNLYRSVFEREPDAGGLAYYIQQMQHGRTEAQIRAEFQASFEARYLPLYKKHFGRNPTMSEILANNPPLEGGTMTLETLKTNLRKSPSCIADCLR